MPVVRIKDPTMLGEIEYCGGDGYGIAVRWSDGSVTGETDYSIREATLLEILALQADDDA